MARFPIIEESDADPEIREIYSEIKRGMGMTFVQNWFKVQAFEPRMLRANWHKVKSVLLEGDIPMTTKQMILYAVSARRGCNYCAEIHKGVLADLGVSLSVIEAVATGADMSLLPNAVQTAVRAACKAAFDPTTISSEDVQELLDVGYSYSEAMEVFSQADLVNTLNHVADVTGIELDREYFPAETPAVRLAV